MLIDDGVGDTVKRATRCRESRVTCLDARHDPNLTSIF